MESKPLSKNKRFFYLSICVIAFFILTPVVVLYSTGYRFSDKFNLMKTGGIYIVVQGKDFVVYVDEEEQKISSLFRRNFLVQDMKPNTYDVKVVKDGFIQWSKKVTVYPEKVNEIYPFNLPETIDMVEISKMVLKSVVDNGTTTTKNKETDNKEFIYVKNLFLATTTTEKVTGISKVEVVSTSNTSSHKKISVGVDNNEVFVQWLGETDSIPLYFCDPVLNICLTKMSIYNGNNIGRAELFLDRNDLVIFSTKDGVFVTEADGRGGRNIQPIVLGNNYDFRIDDGELFLRKDKTIFYRVNLKS